MASWWDEYDKHHTMVPFLKSNPIEEWTKTTRYGTGLLHFTADRSDISAMKMLLQVIDINVKDCKGRTPLYYACRSAQWTAVKTLIAYGADLRASSDLGYPFDNAGDAITQKILIANGWRVIYHHPTILQFQTHVLETRSSVIAILTLRKKSTEIRKRTCRFIMQEIAVAIWATRYDF